MATASRHQMRPTTREFSAPLGSESEGRLEFPRGAARVTIRAATMPDLFRARFWGGPPKVSVQGGLVVARYPRFSPQRWRRPWDRRGGDLTLNRDAAWGLRFQGGVAQLDADLSDLRVQSIELGRGASHVIVKLPEPSGLVPVRIHGGASRVTILRPRGVAARLDIGTGASNVSFDDQEFGAVGGRLRLQSSGAEDDNDLFEIQISGGASHVRISTDGGRQ
jgi:hypothetical protein